MVAVAVSARLRDYLGIRCGAGFIFPSVTISITSFTSSINPSFIYKLYTNKFTPVQMVFTNSLVTFEFYLSLITQINRHSSI